MYIGKTTDVELTVRLEGYLTETQETKNIPLTITREESLEWEETVDEIVENINKMHYGFTVAEILDKDGNIWY